MKDFSLKRLPIVAFDLAEAGAWYEEREPDAGLAEALDREAETAVLALCTGALHHRIRFRDVRRAPLIRFASFGVYYVVRGPTVIVIAIFHDARDPVRLRQRRREVSNELE